MKTILVDIKEMSDSRELYQSKPNSFLWIFTYILLILIGSAVLWASFGKIEIVVKANGQVRPEAGISTVRNLYGGIVKEINYEQGKEVRKGDLLYIIEHDTLIVEKENLQRQLDDIEKELENLNKYRESIISGQNLFDEATEPVYYHKVNNLLLEIEYTEKNTNYNTLKLEEENKINEAQLAKLLKEEISVEKYIQSLDKNENLLGAESPNDIEYSQKFERYIIARRDLNRQFDEQANQIKASNYESLKLTLNEEIELKKAYEILLESVIQNKNLFDKNNHYSYLYNDYILKKNDLQNQYEEAKSIYYAYLALGNLGISEVEIENARIQMEKAEGTYLNYEDTFTAELKSQIKEKEIRILELESRLSGSTDKETMLNLNEEDRKNALRKLYLDERQNMVELKENLSDTINSLKLSISLGKAQLASIKRDNLENIKDNELLTIEKLKSQEIVATDEKIKSITESKKSLEKSLKKIELDISNAIVEASIDGTVNIIHEMLPGDFITSGQEVLTIIPEDDTAYKMQIFVSNKDIGELNVGDIVKYNFAALPSREYGEMRGQIVNISNDALSLDTTGQSYYLVEATIPGTKLIGANGKQGEIKNGMLCEASIITKQKSFLRYFLEKIDLLD